jgi:hypothetical protein
MNPHNRISAGFEPAAASDAYFHFVCLMIIASGQVLR